MWWLWPHLRRLLAAAGTVSAGLAVNYLYGWLENQPASVLSRFTDYLWRYRYWRLSALLAFAVASAFAERQFRKYEARAPRPLRKKGSPIRTLFSRFKLDTVECVKDYRTPDARGKIRAERTIRRFASTWSIRNHTARSKTSRDGRTLVLGNVLSGTQ